MGALLDDFIKFIQSIDMTDMRDDIRSAILNASTALADAQNALSKSDNAMDTASAASNRALEAVNEATKALTTANTAKLAADTAGSRADSAVTLATRLEEAVGTMRAAVALLTPEKVADEATMEAMIKDGTYTPGQIYYTEEED